MHSGGTMLAVCSLDLSNARLLFQNPCRSHCNSPNAIVETGLPMCLRRKASTVTPFSTESLFSAVRFSFFWGSQYCHGRFGTSRLPVTWQETEVFAVLIVCLVGAP